MGAALATLRGRSSAMVEAMRLLTPTARAGRGTLLGVFVADEEAASEGAKHFAAARTADRLYYDRRADLERNGHRTQGQPAAVGARLWRDGAFRHAGSRRNAIYDAARVRSRGRSASCAAREAPSTHPLVGAASLTITRALAGVADNVVPDRCDLLLDRRMIPGEDEEKVKREIAEVLDWRRPGSGCEQRSSTISQRRGERRKPLPITRSSRQPRGGQRNGAAKRGPLGFKALATSSISIRSERAVP